MEYAVFLAWGAIIIWGGTLLVIIVSLVVRRLRARGRQARERAPHPPR